MGLTLIRGKRQAEAGLSLSGDADEDAGRLQSALAGLREALAASPEDPYLLVNEAVHATERHIGAPDPDPEDLIDAVLEAGEGRDLVGFVASGPVWTGFANARGQRNWTRRAPSTPTGASIWAATRR